MTIIEKPTNWREAADTELRLMDRNVKAFSRVNPVDTMVSFSLDLQRDAMMNITGRSGGEQLLGHRLVSMGTLAAAHLDTLGLWSRSEMLDLLCRKQHDYGHGNILSFGMVGVAVRMSDKVARLENLTKRDIDAVNESLLDTWRDIVGYSVIAGMLLVDTFKLEL